MCEYKNINGEFIEEKKELVEENSIIEPITFERWKEILTEHLASRGTTGTNVKLSPSEEIKAYLEKYTAGEYNNSMSEIQKEYIVKFWVNSNEEIERQKWLINSNEEIEGQICLIVGMSRAENVNYHRLQRQESYRYLRNLLKAHAEHEQNRRKKAEYKNTRYENKSKPARKSALLNTLINRV